MSETGREMMEALSTHAAKAYAAARAPIGTWPARVGSVCAICVDVYEPREVAARLPCGHSFHSRCILPHLREATSQGVRRQCPICGANVPNTLAATRLALVNSHARSEYSTVTSNQAESNVSDEDVYEALSAALLAARYTAPTSTTDSDTNSTLTQHNILCDICNNHGAHSEVLRELPCAHWICNTCDTHAQVRCPNCAAFRVDGAVATRWSARYASKREHAAKRCTDIAAIGRGERPCLSTVEERYAFLCALPTVPTLVSLDQLIDATRHALSTDYSSLSQLTLQHVLIPEDVVRDTVEEVIDLTVEQAIETGQNGVPVAVNSQTATEQAQCQDSMSVAGSPVTSHDVEEHICVVCLSPLEVGCEVLQLGCTHTFHYECISAYLRAAPRAQCPLCRIPVPRTSLDALVPFAWRSNS